MNDLIAACLENLGLIEDVPDFLDHVITCDESWIHYFDPKSKQENSEKEDTPSEIGGEGAYGGFFHRPRTHLSAHGS